MIVIDTNILARAIAEEADADARRCRPTAPGWTWPMRCILRSPAFAAAWPPLMRALPRLPGAWI
jgi:hypothetical protein